MKKGGGSESTIIIGPSKSVLVYALHSLEYVLGRSRFRVFMPNLLLYQLKNSYFMKLWQENYNTNYIIIYIFILQHRRAYFTKYYNYDE